MSFRLLAFTQVRKFQRPYNATPRKYYNEKTTMNCVTKCSNVVLDPVYIRANVSGFVTKPECFRTGFVTKEL